MPEVEVWEIEKYETRTGHALLGVMLSRAFLEELPGSRAAALKGPKAASSRWFSVLKAFAFWTEEWNTKLLLLLFVAVGKNFSTSIGDARAPDKKKVGEAQAVVAAHEALENGHSLAAEGAIVPAGAAPSSTARPGSPRGTKRPAALDDPPAASVAARATTASSSASGTKAAGFAEGKARFDQERQRYNTLHAVCRLMFDSGLRHDIEIVALATKPT